ncbi:replication initiator protein A [Streptococcus sanguinis]|uniref:replication initiator protein A n=1 Tax=Streptococcus sanguinis TaxID=1305 RepID=UPI001CC1284C|nr:replication initiator protein A [Streptococcus sanguinis]MBZ2023056.1 replication initiator protein A [Streptococcus sanguinis]MBZ2047886.1 replication initiator protein A [Streptococcus sanguinis]MBZ2050344.1 replication initiator protein A [Streptococcus sanguinis]MBZ2059323.1 replication initiator protein A [Streptococcus sanguinis]MCC3176752.1 replication initiator A family protein [Streptococcus sanguinis]
MVDNGRISLAQGLGSESFYQLPKVMIGSKYYSKLKSEAKMMFMLLRDRMGASIENARKGDMRFVDDNQDVFIYYPIEELVEDLGWKRDKVMSLKKQLIKYDLIDEVRQGLKKANRIYVKNVETRIELLNMDFEQKKQSENPVKSPEVGKTDFKKSEKSTSRGRENRLQEVGKSDSSKNKSSEIKQSENKNNIDSSRKAGADSLSIQKKSEEKYIQPEYYSLLQVIADSYNDKFAYDYNRREIYNLTHRQKMLIGQFLADGYMTSQEILDTIERMPFDTEQPLAYLLKCLENLKEERRLEAKIAAHRNAELRYGG